MKAEYSSGDSVGWMVIPIAMVALLWITVFGGVAAPLGRLLGGGRTSTAEVIKAPAHHRGEGLGAKLPCVCATAAGPELRAR